MRQAIVTKYLGPTNHRGARILVKAEAGRRTYPWDHALSTADNHAQAAERFAREYGWLDDGTTLQGGGLPGGDGYCFVLVTATEK